MFTGNSKQALLLRYANTRGLGLTPWGFATGRRERSYCDSASDMNQFADMDSRHHLKKDVGQK